MKTNNKKFNIIVKEKQPGKSYQLQGEWWGELLWIDIN